MSFLIDHRIASTCFDLGDWPLSCVLLKNDASYPWFILVPRQESTQEIHHLSPSFGHLLMDEIQQLSSIVNLYFKPDKLNIGALGNIVPQLHVHIIARYKTDALWPHGVWQATNSPVLTYEEKSLSILLSDLRCLIQEKCPVVV